MDAKIVQSRIDALCELPDKTDPFTETSLLRESEGIIGEVRLTDCTAKWLNHSIQDKVLVFSTQEEVNRFKSQKDKLALTKINLVVAPGELIAVIGSVGSGKSSLIHAIMNQIHISEGSARCSGSIAYISQSPFLVNDTLKENILFGSGYDEKRYFAVLKLCQLE